MIASTTNSSTKVKPWETRVGAGRLACHAILGSLSVVEVERCELLTTLGCLTGFPAAVRHRRGGRSETRFIPAGLVIDNFLYRTSSSIWP
jgi:hypothetical protein